MQFTRLSAGSLQVRLGEGSLLRQASGGVSIAYERSSEISSVVDDVDTGFVPSSRKGYTSRSAMGLSMESLPSVEVAQSPRGGVASAPDESTQASPSAVFPPLEPLWAKHSDQLMDKLSIGQQQRQPDGTSQAAEAATSAAAPPRPIRFGPAAPAPPAAARPSASDPDPEPLPAIKYYIASKGYLNVQCPWCSNFCTNVSEEYVAVLGNMFYCTHHSCGRPVAMPVKEKKEKKTRFWQKA